MVGERDKWWQKERDRETEIFSRTRGIRKHRYKQVKREACVDPSGVFVSPQRIIKTGLSIIIRSSSNCVRSSTAAAGPESEHEPDSESEVNATINLELDPGIDPESDAESDQSQNKNDM